MKITYLLGAGASYNAIPIIDEFSNELKVMRNRLDIILKNNYLSDSHFITSLDKNNNSIKEIHKSNTFSFVINFEDYINELVLLDKEYVKICKNKKFLSNIIIKLDNLIKGFNEFETLDTFCKYLYITETSESENYKEVKKIYNIFMLLFQNHFYLFDRKLDENKSIVNYKNFIDYRYITFLTNVMTNKEFPGNIKILTWNYDLQFEKALLKFMKPTNIEEFEEKLKSIIFHINGTSQLEKRYYIDTFAINEYDKKFKYNLLKDLKKNYSNDNSHTHLKFSWEYSSFEESLKSNLNNENLFINWSNHIKETEHLIYIGYSFPFVNRKIDNEILRLFDIKNKLKKITIQNPNNILNDFVLNNFEPAFIDMDTSYPNNLKNEIKHNNITKNFFIPKVF